MKHLVCSRFVLAAASATLVGLCVSMPAAAQHATGQPSPQEFRAYLNADGTYPTVADYVRSVEGIPCGMNCTRDTELRASQQGKNFR